MKVVKVTSKGQITIPIEVRDTLGIDEGTYLEVSADGGEIRLRKLLPVRPLSDRDPIWELVGAGQRGYWDVAEQHDRHVADAEILRYLRLADERRKKDSSFPNWRDFREAIVEGAAEHGNGRRRDLDPATYANRVRRRSSGLHDYRLTV